jgi:Orsellinic acid/F9775 biosynthesis cluster protein D
MDTQVTDIIKDMFGYIPSHLLLACKHCGWVILGSCLQSHLGTVHRYDTRFCQEISALIKERYPNILWSKGDMAALQLPDPSCAPLPFLPIYYDGIRCPYPDPENGNQCMKVYRSIYSIQSHCRKDHDWINPRRRGRAPKGISIQPGAGLPPLTSQVACQRLFNWNSKSWYFEVHDPKNIRERY